MTAPSTCTPCCNTGQMANSELSYRASSLELLCQILAALGGDDSGAVRYDWEILCDPTTETPVFVRFEYTTDGTVVGSTGYYADGSVYAGVLTALVPCEESVIAAMYSAMVTKAFGFFTNAFQAIGLIASGSARQVEIWNDTDANMIGSWDGGVTTHFIIPSRAVKTIPFYLTGVKQSTDVYMKYASAPTTGNVYFEAIK